MFRLPKCCAARHHARNARHDGTRMRCGEDTGAERGGHDKEYKKLVCTAWAPYHARQALGRTPGHLTQKLRLLQMMVFASLWCDSGKRHRTAAELRGLYTLQTKDAPSREVVAASRGAIPAVRAPHEPLGDMKLGHRQDPCVGHRSLPRGGVGQAT